MKKTYTEIEEDVEEWKYISIFTNENVTYDFRIRERNDVINFIVALSDSTLSLNSKFFGFTNRTLISQIMIRQKLNKIADLKGRSLHQLCAQALFKTASEEFVERTIVEKKEKF